MLNFPSPPVTHQPPAPIEAVDPPASLAPEELDIWRRQAPFALANRTLTPATSMAFERYVRVVSLERHEAKSSSRGGANHRGLLRQIAAYEVQFCLAPMGKPMAPPVVPAVDEDDAFFGGAAAPAPAVSQPVPAAASMVKTEPVGRLLAVMREASARGCPLRSANLAILAAAVQRSAGLRAWRTLIDSGQIVLRADGWHACE